ncbi:hypothetical protein BH09VER1_BH09VER1_23600 [soil metagenome]
MASTASWNYCLPMPKAANVLNREKSERSLGSLFAVARQKRGVAIEKAAHDTRIRVQRLREIEEDDFSHFSHPSYARLFLADYGRYLGIPSEDIKHLLPERGECGAEGYQYLQEVTVAAPTYSYTIPRAPKQRRLMPAVATICLIPVALVVTFFGFKLVRDYNRLNARGTVVQDATPSKAVETSSVLPEKSEVAPSNEVGVDNAVPATESASTDSDSATASVSPAATDAVTPAPDSSSSPGASPAPASPDVSPETARADRAALLVGGSADASGRLQ